MTGRHSLLPTTASPICTRALLPLLLVALCCCAPAAPASSVVRQGPDDALGQAEGMGAPGGVWLRGRTFHPPETGDSNIPKGSGEAAVSRTSGDGTVIGDYGGELHSRRYLHKGKYPAARKTSHRSRKSLDADGPESENGERSSSSFFVSSDWSRGSETQEREGARDIRPGNWPQEAGEFERVSSGDENERKASPSQHKFSIMAETGEGGRLEREEDHSRLGREVVDGEWGEDEGNILSSAIQDSQAGRKAAHTTFDGIDNPVAPLEESLAAIGAVEDQDDDDAFNGPVENVGNLEHSLPSINPAVFPLRENSWYPGRGTMSLEAPQAGQDNEGFLDSWGMPADLGSLQTNLAEQTFMERDEGLRREEPSLPHLPDLDEPGCECKDTECNCVNWDIQQIPTNFTSNVTIITMTLVNLKTIRNDSFTRYRETLNEIVFENVEELTTVEAGAFKGLEQLRVIYIQSAPKLRTLPNLTFNEDNSKLRSFRITNSGLEEIPNIQNIASGKIINMVEIDTSRIRRVRSRSLRIIVDSLSLSFNQIEEVEKEAFYGSQIGTLSMKGNTRLRHLDPEAFKGIASIRTLDLSQTSITTLPTMGLTQLENLFLERTPTLKVFPSVYSFKNIKKALLTYPYHCCAFQFPQQHDPLRYREAIRKLEQLCSDVTSPNPLLLTSTPPPRTRRFKSHVTGPSSAVSQTAGNVYDKFSAERFSDQARTLETWGAIAHGEGGAAAFSLSSPSSMEEAGGKTKRHGHSRQFERPQSPLEVSPAKLHSTLPQRRKELPEVTTDQASSSLTRSHARHSGHHTRVLRPQGVSDAESPEGSGPTSVKPKVRFRRHSHTHLGPRSARVTRSQDAAKAALRPQMRFGQQAAALIREPDEVKISRPEKRDPHSDHLNFYSSQPRKEFTGGSIGGHFPLPLGFGPFNKTHARLPQSIPRPNTSTQGWDTHVWQEAAPPLDSGDEATYLLGPAEHPEDPHQGEAGGTFHAEAGEVWHKAHEVGGTKHTSKWLPGQAHVPTNMYVPCGNLSKNYHDVECEPGPDAFNPCEDIMGNLALRVAVWLVVVTAVVGNLAVMVVLISSKFKMTVSKFLMVNLALADLCMGLYLLIIAAMDLHTIGDYFNYAIDWQNGPGCKVAGFLTVFASELSIFTLTVITSERWYAITYAIHLNKRLKLSMAVKMMVGGWTYSITMAALPLVGVSSYSKTSICLPMETGDGLSLAYLVSLLLVNGLAFFVITACYASMYFSISRNDAMAPHSDLTVAKRMALLVFTDFACWAPIAFFGLTAVAGLPLINVTRAKILLVFFYPLNSCANPYLYAILTKQYRRDLFILLGRYGFCTKRAMKYKGAYSSVNNTFPPNTGVNAPNHRSSTLTQITLCDLSRTRTSQQSNNGSLLGGTIVVGSQESLQRNVSPLRTPTKPETCCGGSAGENERLSTVQEMSHSTHSDDEASDDHMLSGDDDSHSGVMKQAGSPHPIKNCYTRLSFTPEQEEILKQALNESKAKKKRGKTEKENVDQAGRHGEAIVICIREVCPKEIKIDRRGRHRVSSLHEEEEEVEEEEDYEELEGKMEVTSTV